MGTLLEVYCWGMCHLIIYHLIRYELDETVEGHNLREVVWAVDVILCRTKCSTAHLLSSTPNSIKEKVFRKKIPIKNGKFLWPTRTKINFQKNIFDLERKSSSNCWENWTRQLQKSQLRIFLLIKFIFEGQMKTLECWKLTQLWNTK